MESQLAAVAERDSGIYFEDGRIGAFTFPVACPTGVPERANEPDPALRPPAAEPVRAAR